MRNCKVFWKNVKKVVVVDCKELFVEVIVDTKRFKISWLVDIEQGN